MNAVSFVNQSYGRDLAHHIVKLVTAFLLLSFAVSTQNVSGDSQGNKASVTGTVYFSNLSNDIDYGINALNAVVLKAKDTPEDRLLAEMKVLKTEIDRAIALHKQAHPNMLYATAQFEERLNQYYVHAFYFIRKAQAASLQHSSRYLSVAEKQLESRFVAMTSSLNNLKKSS